MQTCQFENIFITILFVFCAFDTNTKKIDKQNCLLIIIEDIHGHTYSLSIRPGFWSTTNFWMLLHKLYRSLDDTIHNLVCLTSINLNHLNFETWITYARWIVTLTSTHSRTYIPTHIHIMPMKKLKCINTFVHVSRYM